MLRAHPPLTVRTDAAGLPLADETFDAVTAPNMLNHTLTVDRWDAPLVTLPNAAAVRHYRRTRQPMTPARRRSQPRGRDACGADSDGRTKPSELRVLDGVRTGGLTRVTTDGF